MARLFHDFHHAVVADAVFTVGVDRIDVRVEGARGGHGVALDAGHLHEAADGVAGEAEVMFEGHLGRIFDLSRGAAEELTGGCGGHGAGHADLPLATHLCAGDRGVLLGDVTKQAGRR